MTLRLSQDFLQKKPPLALILYINGQLADLAAGQVIAQTKQVNDLNSLDNRQTNYTNKFNLPKTANNVRIMNFLTVTGNVSTIPYQKNSCSLYSETGECFVYNGWAVVTDGGDDYEVVVYDGIIDLYKLVENQNLSAIGLTELVHSKTISEVTNSWSGGDKKYRYILADYNGVTGAVNLSATVTTPQVNIDYLVPSVNVAWLWQKIFDFYKISYTGDVFTTPDFLNLWMTFSKGLTIAGENYHTVFESDDYGFVYPAPTTTTYYLSKFNTLTTSEIEQSIGNIHLKVNETATYALEITGTLYGQGVQREKQPKDAWLRIGKNIGTGNYAWTNKDYLFTNAGSSIFGYTLNGNIQHDKADGLRYGNEFILKSEPFELKQSDSICVRIQNASSESGSFTLYKGNEHKLHVKLSRVDANVIDFTTAFTDFSIKDFLNEIVQRFGLTMFKDKYTNNYHFLTLTQQLQSAKTINWSKKFNSKTGESYLYSNYARRNWFRYTYNDKEATHHDGYLDVNNVNLADSRTVIQSKIYGPEKVKSAYLSKDYKTVNTNVYKLWEKEVVEDPQPDEDPVKYNALDKRYYFMRGTHITGNTIKVYSKGLGNSTIVNSYYRENYGGLDFKSILKNYYNPLERILDAALIVNAEIWLTDTDVINFDFKQMYYIEQLGGSFIVNKINNYVPGKVTKCELVRVKGGDATLLIPSLEIVITSQIRFDQRFMSLGFTTNYSNGILDVQYSSNQSNWATVNTTSTSPVTIQLTGYKGEMRYIRIIDRENNVTSGTITVVL